MRFPELPAAGVAGGMRVRTYVYPTRVLGGGGTMVQKVSDVVGISPQSFANAAENAVIEAGKTVRGMKWARVSDLEMELDGSKIKNYRATVRIYFDVER